MKRLKDLYVLGVDQGTSGTMAALYDHNGLQVGSVDKKVHSFSPKPGWVEQDPYELLDSIFLATRQLIYESEISPHQIVSFGLANQGEYLLVWDRSTGKPVYNVIGWQCTRSADLCDRLKQAGFEKEFRARTGLPVDPEWPATKIPWILEHVPEARELALAGRLVYSQLDTWFIYQLTREKRILSDYSTASRSGFYNIFRFEWDQELIRVFSAEPLIFPEVVDSSADFGTVDFGNGWQFPLNGSALDQSAALLGQGGVHPGDMKITYGTCASLWYNCGANPKSARALDTSIAWRVPAHTAFAVVGEMTAAGSTLEWMRSKLSIPWGNSELAEVASSVDDSDVVFVPAINGLGAPHWVPNVRGVLYGLSGVTGMDHILRAGLDSIAFGIRDLIEVLAKENPLSVRIIADGGMCANDYLMQLQADVLGKMIVIPEDNEGTIKGVAILAGIRGGFYPGIDFGKETWHARRIFEPEIPAEKVERRYQFWRECIANSIDLYTRRKRDQI